VEREIVTEFGKSVTLTDRINILSRHVTDQSGKSCGLHDCLTGVPPSEYLFNRLQSNKALWDIRIAVIPIMIGEVSLEISLLIATVSMVFCAVINKYSDGGTHVNRS